MLNTLVASLDKTNLMILSVPLERLPCEKHVDGVEQFKYPPIIYWCIEVYLTLLY